MYIGFVLSNKLKRVFNFIEIDVVVMDYAHKVFENCLNPYKYDIKKKHKF